MRLPRTGVAVSVHGDATTKGNMICIGQVGPIKHKLVEQTKTPHKRWLKTLDPAGVKLRELVGGVVDAPIGIELVFTLERPDSVPAWKRPWPAVRNGDVDKLARFVLDALTVTKKRPQLGVISDDAIVCELLVRKVYPDTPDAPDRLVRPGVVIRLYPLDEPPAELPYEQLADEERIGE